MGKLNEIQEQTTQSWGDNSFTTKLTDTTVEFDSAKDSFTFNDPVNVPELRISGTEIATFDAEDKAKLDSLTSPMQVKGRVDGISDLPEHASVGDVYLVGLSGARNFEEYVCVEVSGDPATPVWENLGHVKVQSDWDQSNISADNYIKNKPVIKAGQGENSIIEGDLVGNSSMGNYSHTEGGGTIARGDNSHAEGYQTMASGTSSHAEGSGTIASGVRAHAEGYQTTSSGVSAHAEGVNTMARGTNSHAEGCDTIANNKCQHVFGEYNALDPSAALSNARGNYIEIVGNGADVTNRSNARTLDWSGNEVLSGTITANGINLNEEINLKEPLLPATPTQPESKFLNANKQWVEMTVGHSQLRDLNGDSSYLHITSAEKAAFAAKQDALIAGNNITIVGNTISSTGGLTNVYKSITIENPTASENMCIFYAPFAMTITEIRGVITGGNSVSFKVVSGTSRNAVTTEHNSSAVVCSSVTTGDVATITTAAIAAGSWVAVKTSAVEGAPSELVITLSLTF